MLPWTAFFLIAPFKGKHWHTINHTVGALIIFFPLLVLLLFWYHQAFKRRGQTEKMNVIGRNSTIALAVCALALFGASLLSRHL